MTAGAGDVPGDGEPEDAAAEDGRTAAGQPGAAAGDPATGGPAQPAAGQREADTGAPVAGGRAQDADAAGPKTNGRQDAAEAAPGPSGTAPRRGFSRRAFLGGAAAGTALGALGAIGTEAFLDRQRVGSTMDLAASYPFYGQAHQGGVTTPPQRYCVYSTFDMTSTSVRDLQVVLARWSAAISLLQAGKPVGEVQPPTGQGVPSDTGEAYGLDPASLTVTVGLGPSLFDSRFGLAGRRPRLLQKLPSLPSDNIDPALDGGDLSLQACADDPQVAYHAVRNLARIARGQVQTRWTVLGFGRASAGPGQQTPRNLMGFKDGTRNATTTDLQRQYVWAHDSDQRWMRGGTYQIARKIRMRLEIWDADRVGDQEETFGRTKREGAPLSGGTEFTTPDFHRRGPDGQPRIPVDSHIALAAHEHNDGVRILRRPYNYTDGLDADGQLDAGLIFICYQNDPEHFVRIQRRLGASDRLNEYISHIGSALFAVPPAPREGHYLAEGLFS
ncbi:MAG: iron uptake transporter deferrochelatase/peroxidase subunit [Pseudoclavibacter sp.]